MTRAIAAFAAAALLTACTESTRARVPATLQLDQQAVTMEVAQTVVIGVTVLDQDGTPFTAIPDNLVITWTSSQPAVASVTNGTVTGIRSGNATITASAQGVSAVTVPITVNYVGQLAFNYSGDRSGMFSASSTFQVPAAGLLGGPAPVVPQAAISFYDTDFLSQDLIAYRTRTDLRIDLAWFWTDGPPVTMAGNRSVSGGFIIFGLAPGGDYEAWYFVFGGSIVFAAPAQQKLSGTFTLEADHEDTFALLDITGGTFSVPVLSEQELFGPAAALRIGRDEAGHRVLPFDLGAIRRR